MRSPRPADEVAGKPGIRSDTLKARLRAEWSGPAWFAVVQESLQVGEKEVNEAARRAATKRSRGVEYNCSRSCDRARGSAPSAIELRRKKPRRCASGSRAATKPAPISVDAERRGQEPVTKTSAIFRPLREVSTRRYRH